MRSRTPIPIVLLLLAMVAIAGTAIAAKRTLDPNPANDTACGDKTQYNGMFRIWEGRAVTASVHAPEGKTGVLDPFFFSFQFLAR